VSFFTLLISLRYVGSFVAIKLERVDKSFSIARSVVPFISATTAPGPPRLMLLTSDYSLMCNHPAKALNGISSAFSVNRFRTLTSLCPYKGRGVL
jgi:hypothetical protein